MEIVVGKPELMRELTATHGVVERKTTIPILSNYLFEIVDGKVALTATDLDVSLRTSFGAAVKSDGACTVPARKLHDYVKLLPESDITIKMLENNWISVRCGRSHTKMVGMDKSNFPNIPVFPSDGVISLPANLLREMIDRVTFAIAAEESRYTLNGALLLLTPDTITMVATDGHRLAHIEAQHKLDSVSGSNRTLVPKKCLDELRTLLDGAEGNIEHAKDGSSLFFRVGGRVLTSRQLMGQFPNYEAVLPKESTKVATVKRKELEAALARVSQFADERSRAVRLHLEANDVKLSASSTESGNSEDLVGTTYSGDPLTAGFNAEYVLDFLKAVGSDEVRIELRDAQSAAQFQPVGGNYRYRVIVMPMRI